MEALYSPKCDLVGWLQPGKAIFDPDMKYVAFIANEHAWSAKTGNWLGPSDHTNFLDRSGKPVTFGARYTPKGRMAPMIPMRAMKPMVPMKPMKPMKPMRPMKPMTPMNGWSQMSFEEWINQ